MCSHTGTPPMQVVGINMFKTKKRERSAVEPRVFFTTQAKMPVPIDIISPYLKKAGKFSEKNLGKIIKKSIPFLIATHLHNQNMKARFKYMTKKNHLFSPQESKQIFKNPSTKRQNKKKHLQGKKNGGGGVEICSGEGKN